MAQTENRLYAYVINPGLGMPLRTAPHDRDWMNAWHDKAPYRCLPLVIANQAGWLIHNSTPFTATWNGGHSQESLRLDFGTGPAAPPAQAGFGFGFGVGVVNVAAPKVEPPPRHISSLFGGGVLTFN